VSADERVLLNVEVSTIHRKFIGEVVEAFERIDSLFLRSCECNCDEE